MESRKLAALLSSLISQLLLLLLLIFPPNPTHSNSSNFPLIHHFLFSHETAATATFLSRKRKRRGEPSSASPRRSPDWFRASFLMTSSTFEWLSGLLEPLLDCRDPADLLPLNLSSGVRLGIGLFRLATGSDYPDISDRFGVSVPVARFCVKQLCRVLCTNFRFWLSFPGPNDLPSVSNGFETLSGLPNCCGVVFCSRFDISASSSTQNHRVAAQIVVDSTYRILSIAAGFLGEKSDAEILKASSLCEDIEGGTLLNAPPNVNVNQYLIGDSGYPLLPWLMVPFAEAASGSDEANFNEVHRCMRLTALKTEASLKNWGVLSKPVNEEVKMAVAYIGACSILHNSLLMREDFSALASGFDYDHQELHPQTNHQVQHCALEDDPVTNKALVMRSTLATMAKKIS